MAHWQYAADVPTVQFRSANTLPREIGLFSGSDGQIYASSVPSPELEAIRGRLAVNRRNASVGAKPSHFALPSENSGVCEILLNINAQKADKVDITLSNKAGDKVTMIYDTAAHTLSFDRTKSGVVDFSDSFPAVTVAPTFETDGSIKLRLYIDRSSIELFGNDGRFAMTNLVFPNMPYDSMSVSATGGKVKITDLKIYSLK